MTRVLSLSCSKPCSPVSPLSNMIPLKAHSTAPCLSLPKANCVSSVHQADRHIHSPYANHSLIRLNLQQTMSQSRKLAEQVAQMRALARSGAAVVKKPGCTYYQRNMQLMTLIAISPFDLLSQTASTSGTRTHTQAVSISLPHLHTLTWLLHAYISLLALIFCSL